MKNLIYNIQRVLDYLPIIWRDRDWDEYFMLRLWAKKFDRMACYFEKHGICVDNTKQAAECRMCANLCRRINADEYGDILNQRHDEKWGELHTCFDDHRMIFSRPFAITEDEKIQEREESTRIFRKAEEQRHADIVYLTDIIRKHLLTWWD